MENFKEYNRVKKAQLRHITKEEGHYEAEQFQDIFGVQVSTEDARNGSPKDGDMVARNPENHNDQWLVAAKYFKENFEEI